MKKRILLVEDEKQVRDMLEEYLAMCGFEVEVISSGEEARNIIEKGEERIDLILSDINLPGMSGLELLKRIRLIWPKLPVILMSGRPRLYRDEAIKCGANAFLGKPFDLKEIRKMIIDLTELQKEGG